MTAWLSITNVHGETIAHALVDDDIAAACGGVRWHLDNGYVRRATTINRRHIQLYLHRLVLGLGPADKRVTDHINGDPLDNRRENLRIATTALNAQNQGSRGGTSHYRGVSWCATRRRWLAQATLDGHKHSLGRYDHELEAAEAAAEFRRRNMPFAAADHKEAA